MQFHFWLHMYMLTNGHSRCRFDYKDGEGHMYILQRSNCRVIFSPWSKTVIPFPETKIQTHKDDTKLGKIRNKWSRCNHWFNPIKIYRYNTLDVNLMDMNKFNIIQLVPKRACEHSVDTCTYCKYEAPHPSPTPSDWSSKYWKGEKAKARE